MRLRVALNLRHLDQRLPLHARSGIFRRQHVAVAVGSAEHQAAGYIGIVRDRNELGAGCLARDVEPVPQVFRLVAVERVIRNKLSARFVALFHDNDAMQVVAVRRR